MINNEIKIIFEGETITKKMWCQKLDIADFEFEGLLNYAILKQTDKDIYRNTFVGTIKLKNNLFYSIPKCFSNVNSDEDTIKNIIKLVDKSLVVYKKRVDKTKAVRNEENFYLSIRHLNNRTEFDLMLTLKENYLKNGLLRKSINKYEEKQTFTRVNWQKTISKTQPIYSNGTPIYVKPISNKKLRQENNVTILHLSILNYLAKKYYFFENGNNFATLLKTENIEYLSEYELKKDINSWINLLNIELRNTYRDDIKETLILLKEFFFENGFNSKNIFNFYGTSYYHMVWEDALKVAAHDTYTEYISQIAQPNYHLLKNGINVKVMQEPDILIEKNNSFYILDAKYYILEKNMPGWKDIVKQLYYHKSFVPKKQYNKIENYFLIPLFIELNKQKINTPDEYLGNIIVELDNQTLTDFTPIHILGLNPIKVFSNYISFKPEQLNFTNFNF